MSNEHQAKQKTSPKNQQKTRSRSFFSMLSLLVFALTLFVSVGSSFYTWRLNHSLEQQLEKQSLNQSQTAERMHLALNEQQSTINQLKQSINNASQHNTNHQVLITSLSTLIHYAFIEAHFIHQPSNAIHLLSIAHQKTVLSNLPGKQPLAATLETDLQSLSHFNQRNTDKTIAIMNGLVDQMNALPTAKKYSYAIVNPSTASTSYHWLNMLIDYFSQFIRIKKEANNATELSEIINRSTAKQILFLELTQARWYFLQQDKPSFLTSLNTFQTTLQKAYPNLPATAAILESCHSLIDEAPFLPKDVLKHSLAAIDSLTTHKFSKDPS